MSVHHYDPKATVRAYLMVFSALMVFTALTVGAAYVDMGAMNNVVALAIAVAKALMVMLIFMHVRESSPLIWLTVGAGVLFFVIMIGLTMVDMTSRGLMGILGK
ncbi:MAG TPA: cytochrome C oxidase subunit IV family protein [Candidatus Limnocylindrales bacterium]|nr:cytochrome C oxidase subunit IV family protein [Candidatus Limnocylindrales bacterium]